MLTWSFPDRPMPSAVRYNRLAILEVDIRLPVGGAPGGEIVLACWRDEDTVETVRIALDPGFEMPADLNAALSAWVEQVLTSRHMLGPDAAPAPRPKPKQPEPAPAPPGFAPILG